MAEALLLPPAGVRNYSNADVYDVGSNGYYWSSTPYNANLANYLNFSSSNILPQGRNYRAYGSSVRCFRNPPQPIEITYDPNG